MGDSSRGQAFNTEHSNAFLDMTMIDNGKSFEDALINSAFSVPCEVKFNLVSLSDSEFDGYERRGGKCPSPPLPTLSIVSSDFVAKDIELEKN